MLYRSFLCLHALMLKVCNMHMGLSAKNKMYLYGYVYTSVLPICNIAKIVNNNQDYISFY